jgi:glycosyltransferase involved in cell wall biosynthesis
MRVLFMLHAHPELQAGGTEIFARDLFRALRDRDVGGLFVAATAAHQRPPSPGTPFQSIGQAADEVLIWTGGFDPFFQSQIDLHGVGNTIADLLTEQQPDIVHFHHLMGLGCELIGLVRRCAPNARIVMTLHDYYPLCANDGQMVTTAGQLCETARPDACRQCFPDRTLTDLKLRELHIGRALDEVDLLISPSEFLKNRYVAHGFAADRIAVIPNGLPHQTPVPADHAERRDRFAFFGHINRFKGANVALEASAILSRQGVEHQFSLYGGTSFQTEETIARFRSKCDQAPDARYRGPYRRADFARLVANADWIVFPSEWWENAPLVINEAFQHGRPVICSALGGAAELVKDGVNGLYFPVSDPQALASAMRRAAQEPGLWQRLVDGIKPPLSIDESASRHLALYDTLVLGADQQVAA